VGSVGGCGCCECGAEEDYCRGGVVEEHRVCLFVDGIGSGEEMGKIRRVWDDMLLLKGELELMIPTTMAQRHQDLLYCLFFLTHGPSTRGISNQQVVAAELTAWSETLSPAGTAEGFVQPTLIC
jgi:hypothetical protein